jgi:cytochrome c-type biogenesis protein CcmF
VDYPAAGRPTTEVGILPGPTGDIYVALGEPDQNTGKWAVRMYHKPLVHWIYWGVTMMAFGGVAGLFALARRRKAAAAASPAPTAAPSAEPAAEPARVAP